MPSYLQRASASTSRKFVPQYANDMARLEIDAAANTRNAEKISNASGRIAAFVIPTDEEQVIADEALFVLKQK
jgi:acetate kinase